MLAGAQRRVSRYFYGSRVRAGTRRVGRTGSVGAIAILGGALFILVGGMTGRPAHAQGASAPGFDPRQAERKFDTQADQRPAGPPLRAPRPSFADTKADPTPLFVLRKVSVSGAQALVPELIGRTYHAYLGKKVSQADLAAIA